MRVLRPIVSVVTALAFFAQATGLAYASPPQADVQPVPYNPSQPIPVPAQPASPAPPAVVVAPTPAGVAPAAVAPPMVAQAPAYAATGPGGDAVYLKGGGMMRGTLVEMLPNDHATIQLPTGQNAIIEWGKIDHIERAPAGMAAQPPIGRVGPRMGPMMRRALEGGSVLVHLEADQGVVLQSISPGSGRWAFVCAAPCDAQLPLAAQYRIAGEGVRPSRPFGIEAPPGQHVTINVAAASRAGFSGGVALSSVGLAGVIVGLSVVLFGALQACNVEDAAGDCLGTANGGVETAGAIITIAGVALTIGGVILMASNARSHATQTIGEVLPPPPARPETAWLRAPFWNDSLRDSALGQPKSMGVPLFSHSF
jgi:hypothetical protein